MDLEVALEKTRHEYARASQSFPAFASCHEGLGIIEEEFEELKREVFKKSFERSPVLLEKEAKQLATMAIRFMVDLCK